jgi:threonine dehydrogenase-like Zn-dependent dehydrogenase
MMFGAGDVRIMDIPDASIQQPTDAVIRVLRACICGTDLHDYREMPASAEGIPMGHEFLGVDEEVGAAVSNIQAGDVVIAPFSWQDNTCDFCREGLQSSCRHGGFWATNGIGGGQAEAVRVPQAQGTLVKVPVKEASALLPSLATLTDVLCTGHHAARTARVSPRTTVTVIGDGAVGLCAVMAAKRLGAERIILMGRHLDRTDLGREFGATDVVSERGEEAVARVLELTNGDGTHAVLECVGFLSALETAFGIVRDGGFVSRVGKPQYDDVPMGFPMFRGNITLTGGVAPVRGYIDELLPDVLDGKIEPGRVFDQTVDLDGVPAGYQAMEDRTALKVLIRP